MVPERVALLRKAFAATMSDKGFLAEAAKSEFDIAPIGGDEVKRIIDDVVGAPADVVAKARAAMAVPGARR